MRRAFSSSFIAESIARRPPVPCGPPHDPEPAMLLTFLPALTLSAALAPAQERRLDSGLPPPPEELAYDVLHYDLALRVDPDKQTIDGTLAMRARVVSPTPRIVLDLDRALSVARVTSGGKELSFVRGADRIT